MTVQFGEKHAYLIAPLCGEESGWPVAQLCGEESGWPVAQLCEQFCWAVLLCGEEGELIIEEKNWFNQKFVNIILSVCVINGRGPLYYNKSFE